MAGYLSQILIKERWYILILLAFLLGGVYTGVHQKINTIIYEIENLPTSYAGEIDLFDIQARGSHARFIHDQTISDGLGRVYYSPVIPLEPGSYRVSYRVKALQILPGTYSLRLEVNEHETGDVLALEITNVQDLTLDEYERISTDVKINPSSTGVSIRTIYAGGGAYWFDYLEIKRTSRTLESTAYITWPLLVGIFGMALTLNRSKLMSGISINAALRYPIVERYVLIFGSLALLGYWLYTVIGKYLLDTEKLVYAYVADDAFYYFETAANLALQGKLSFDGITYTNGFHPLWLLLLTGIYLLGLGKELSLIAGLYFADVLWLISTLLLFWGLRRSVNIFLAFGGTLLFISHAINPLQYGLETAVLMASFVALLVFYDARFQKKLSDISHIDFGILGLLLSVTVLARLDHGIFVLVFLTIMLATNWRSLRSGGGWTKFGLIFAILLFTLLPYLVLNFYTTGHIVPFSGLIKRIWSENMLADAVRLSSYMRAKMDNFLMVVANQIDSFWLLVGNVLILWLVFARRRLASWLSLIPFILGPVAIFGFYLFSFQFPFNSALWYYPTIWLAGMLTITLVADTILSQFRISRSVINRGILIGIAMTIFIIQFLSQINRQQSFFQWIQSQTFEGTYKYFSWQAGEYIQAHTWSSGEDGETIFASADAGVLAYVLDTPVINLDGLINNEILAYEIQGKHWYLYTIDQSKIDYVVNVFKEEWVAPPLFEAHFTPCYISTEFDGDQWGYRIYARNSVLTGNERSSFTSGCVNGQLSSWWAVDLQDDHQKAGEGLTGNSPAEMIICSNAQEDRGISPLISGPGISMPAGTYEADYFLSASDNRGLSEAAHLLITDSRGEILNQRKIAVNEFTSPGEFQRFTVIFQVDQDMREIDFRVHHTGDQPLCIQGIRLLECSAGCLYP